MFAFTFLSQKYHRMVDQAYISASDFSILVEKVPIHISERKIKEEMLRYYESLVFSHNIKNKWGEELKPFSVKKVCRTVPFRLT